MDASFNGSERVPVSQRPPKSDRYLPKPATSVAPQSDYCHRADQAASQHPQMTSPVRDPVVNPHTQCVSSPPSASNAGGSVSLTKASTPPRVSTALAFSGSPTSEPGPPVLSCHDTESVPSQMSCPPNVFLAASAVASSRRSSPPLMVQGLRPPTSGTAELVPAGSKHLSEGSSSPLLTSPVKVCTTPASTESVFRSAACSTDPPHSSSVESLVHHLKSTLPPKASEPPTTVSPSAVVCVPPYAAPSSSLEMQIVHGSTPPLEPCFTDATGVQHEIPSSTKLMSSIPSVSPNSSSSTVAPTLMSTSGPSASTLSSPCLSTSQSSSLGKILSESTAASQCKTHTPPAVDTDHLAASSTLAPSGVVNLPSLAAQDSPAVQPLFTLPLVTTQASRTAPVSTPPASVPPVMGTSSRGVQSSDADQHHLNTTTLPLQLQSSPKSEHRGLSEDRKAMENESNREPKECIPHLDPDAVKTSQVDATETKKSEVCSKKSDIDLPVKALQTTDTPDPNDKNIHTDSEKQHMKSSVISEAGDSMSSPFGKSPQLNSTRVQHLTNEESFNNTSHTASYYDGNSTCDTPSGIHVRSVMEKSSLLGGDGSSLDDSSHFDHSFSMREDSCLFDSTPYTEEDESAIFDSTEESRVSVENSRDDTVDLTNEGETSDAEETRNSQNTGESMFESSLNNTSQNGEPPVDSSDVSNLHSLISSQPVLQGTSTKNLIGTLTFLSLFLLFLQTVFISSIAKHIIEIY